MARRLYALLADPEFDFTDFDAVMVVMPSSHFSGGERRWKGDNG